MKRREGAERRKACEHWLLETPRDSPQQWAVISDREPVCTPVLQKEINFVLPPLPFSVMEEQAMNLLWRT